MRSCLKAALALACASFAVCAAAACDRPGDDGPQCAPFAPHAHAYWVHGASDQAKRPLPRHLRYRHAGKRHARRDAHRARVVQVRRELVTHITIIERMRPRRVPRGTSIEFLY